MDSGTRLLAAAAACALVACAHGGSTGSSQPTLAQVGRPAPDWSEPALRGQSLAMSSLHGKAVYLNFFATWCQGCNEEAAALDSVAREYRTRGLQVVGIDELESSRKAAEFGDAHHLSYPLVVDGGTLREQYEINALPVQVFIDRNGTVQRIVLGQISLAEMRSNVERVLRVRFQTMRVKRTLRRLREGVAFAAAALVAGCAGGGAQGNVLMPAGNSGAGGALGGVGNTVVRIYIPAGSQANSAIAKPITLAPVAGTLPGTFVNPQTPAAPTISTPPPAQGSQVLAFNVTGPATISQTVPVGPNAGGCVPSSGGSTCQLSLSLPAGTYVGTVGSAAIAFTVAPSSNNVLSLTLGGVPSQIDVVSASSMSAQNAQGGIDLYGAGKHLLLVEMLDASGNVMVGGGGASFAMSQAGGSLSIAVAQASGIAPNLFYATAAAAPNGNSAILRATANYVGPTNPCAQSGAVCNGTVRVDVRQLLAVANSGANSVTLYVNGQILPLTTIQNGVSNPQALIFDPAGNLFVANQPGSVTEYVPPYNQAPVAIVNGINHPQSLAIDARGDLFVANGNGSNTVTVYAPPYGAGPSATVSSSVDDPVSLALDSSADLFVVNAAANTVTEYASPYTGPPTTISKGLNTPGSLALDVRGNLFVANLNSTPSSVLEYTPPFTSASAPVATVTNGVNEQGSIAVISANLFVPNQGANTVTEYAAPYTGTPTTIVGGQSQPVALAIDAAGNLYVANYGNNTVTQYAAPYAPGSWTTISGGIAAPLALALSPATSGGASLIP